MHDENSQLRAQNIHSKFITALNRSGREPLRAVGGQWQDTSVAAPQQQRSQRAAAIVLQDRRQGRLLPIRSLKDEGSPRRHSCFACGVGASRSRRRRSWPPSAAGGLPAVSHVRSGCAPL